MYKQRYVIIIGALILVFLSAFIWGGRNNFINGTRQVVSVRYRSTEKIVDKPIQIQPGSGLILTDDNGILIRVRITYHNGNVVDLAEGDIHGIKAKSELSRGVWWITEKGIEYISDRESLRRRKRIFGKW